MPVPMSKVFFNNSGSEANDTAIKIVGTTINGLGRTKKKKIISRQQAYHGVTIADREPNGPAEQPSRLRPADSRISCSPTARIIIASPIRARARKISRHGSPAISTR